MHHMIQCTAITNKGEQCKKMVKATRDINPDTITCGTHGGFTEAIVVPSRIEVENYVPLPTDTFVSKMISMGSDEPNVIVYRTQEGNIIMTPEKKENKMKTIDELGVQRLSALDITTEEKPVYMPEENHTEPGMRPDEYDIIIMATGHRGIINEAWLISALTDLLKKAKEFYASKGQTMCIVAGGADGADRNWARAAVHAGVDFHLVLPANYGEHYHKDHAWFWNMKNAATSVTTVGDPSVKFNWRNNHARNEVMVRMANRYVVISHSSIESLVNGFKGGTVNCVKFMKREGIGVVTHVDYRAKAINKVNLQEVS